MLDELPVDDLKQRLQEKEQMVATLTEYLEQAAAKLNTLQKQTSATKPTRAFDAEMVHRQMELVGDLQDAVKEWEELQAPATLERISTQLETLRETILDGVARQAPPAAMGNLDPHFSEDDSPEPDHDAASGGTKKSGSVLDGWEALKAEMLNENVSETEKKEEERNVDLKEELDVLINRPEPVDPECHDRDVWEKAVDTRENYLISLIRALRVVESRRRGSPDWNSFTEAPEDLREEVAEYASELHQTVRNGEVELSIERARISRQESVIAQQRREIDKANKQRGLGQSKPKNGPNDSQQGRWLKFLGRQNEDGEKPGS